MVFSVTKIKKNVCRWFDLFGENRCHWIVVLEEIVRANIYWINWWCSLKSPYGKRQKSTYILASINECGRSKRGVLGSRRPDIDYLRLHLRQIGVTLNYVLWYSCQIRRQFIYSSQYIFTDSSVRDKRKRLGPVQRVGDGEHSAPGAGREQGAAAAPRTHQWGLWLLTPTDTAIESVLKESIAVVDRLASLRSQWIL